MKSSEKKTALREYLDAKKCLAYWAGKVAELAPLEMYRSPAFTASPSGGGSGNAIEDAVVELEMARGELEKAKSQARAAMARVLAIIDTVPTENQRAVLRRRYIDGMSWEAIAEAEGRSRTWATNVHGTAIKNVKV